MTAYTTRIAPSPTGDFHIGTARTAYFNWLAARSTGGKFILRIDDTDLSRNDPDAVAVIHTCMDWLGLDTDLIVHQSARLDRYRSVAEDLIKTGRAVLADNGAVLVKNGKSAPWVDWISGDQSPGSTAHSLAAGQVLIKSDGRPVYHFATVVDDIDLGVNLIIRGIDHSTNTFRHAGIYNALNADLPSFAHLGLITMAGKKISKRMGAASLLKYRDAGIDPDAMLNFMLRMGWGPRHDDKSMAVIDRDLALNLFLDHGRMKASPAELDSAKLASFNKKYRHKKRLALQTATDHAP